MVSIFEILFYIFYFFSNIYNNPREYMLKFWDKILLSLKTTLHNLQSYVFSDFVIVNSFTLTKQTTIILGWFLYIYIEIELISIHTLVHCEYIIDSNKKLYLFYFIVLKSYFFICKCSFKALFVSTIRGLCIDSNPRF